jgi:hypothetical protein
MPSRSSFAALFLTLISPLGYAQTPAQPGAAAVWSVLSAPQMDPTKSAHVENVTIVRDAVHIALWEGTIQFAQPANGVVFAAVFHGTGRVEATPPNPLEGQQLRLFTKQDKLNMAFTDATFSFTDNLLDEVGTQVKWQASGPAADELYANRQKDREDAGAEYLPRLFKSVLSPNRQRTAYFLADLKTKEKGWVEVRYDALQPEELRIGRSVDLGSGNFFCHSFGWYPTAFAGEPGVDEFAFRSDFDLIFRNPKKYSLVATGNNVSDTIDGKEAISNWKSDIPLATAGFAFGDYKVTTEKVGDVEVQVYANREPDDLLSSIQRAFDNPLNDLAQGPGGSHISGVSLGNLTPAALGKTISIETGNTLRVFESYFGPYPYKHLAVTNIIGSYGQGWPGLLYLGWFTFLDSTQQHELGLKNEVGLTDFFRGHESSHQWWGHRVGWKSYHDQWLSEGFAEFSGKLYVQYRQNQKEFLTQFRKDKELLNTGDIKSHQIDSLGPIWMGQRIRSSETGPGSYQDLIYSKGGYVLQMLREQLIDPRNQDADHLFKDMMKDYCKTFDNKPASTEDFKSIVEKHMTRSMDLDGNHKMDWFFNQYVYGTGIPHYNFHASLEATADGKTHVKGEITRGGVPDSWKDVVPLYAHQGDKTLRLGTISVTHAIEPLDFVLPIKLDRVSINDHEDLLAEVKQ